MCIRDRYICVCCVLPECFPCCNNWVSRLVRWGSGVPGVLKPPKSRKKRIQKKSKRNTLIRQNPPKPISIQKKTRLFYWIHRILGIHINSKEKTFIPQRFNPPIRKPKHDDTAYVWTHSISSSEMHGCLKVARRKTHAKRFHSSCKLHSVSYTHLTLPTKRIV